MNLQVSGVHRYLPGCFAVALAVGIASCVAIETDKVTIDNVVESKQIDYNEDGHPDVVAVENPLGKPANERVLSIYDGKTAKIFPDGKIQVRNSDLLAHKFFTEPYMGKKTYCFGKIDQELGYDLKVSGIGISGKDGFIHFVPKTIFYKNIFDE